jgi:signal transduction histidine kinase
LHISVKNFGIGIKKSGQAKVCNRFYRVENETIGGIGGYGTGLYLAQQNIIQHGGLMWVESEET